MERLQSVLVALLQLIARATVKKINLHALSGCHKTDNYRLSEYNFRCADDTNCISQCARGLASCFEYCPCNEKCPDGCPCNDYHSDYCYDTGLPDYNDMDYDFSCGADDKCTIKLADGQEFHGFRDGKTLELC